MTAEDTPVLMHLINHNIFQVFKELNPKRMVRQDALVQHVGIGHHDVPATADGSPRGFRCVAVESEGFYIHPEIAHDAVNFMHLVLTQGFGWKEVQCSCLRIAQNGVQNRKVVAESFATGGGGRHNKGQAGRCQLNCFSLMTVQLVNSPVAHHLHKPGIQIFRIGRIEGRFRCNNLPPGHMASEFFFGFKLLQKLCQIQRCLPWNWLITDLLGT